MRHVIPAGNWPTVLADTIENAQDGDTIVVHSAAMQELAERALQRMSPDKKLTFEVRRTAEQDIKELFGDV